MLLLLIVLNVFLVLLLSWLLYSYSIQREYCTTVTHHIPNTKRVLLVTAHPDDECMFFAPSIRALLRSDIDVHLLCLSAGEHGKNESAVRKRELHAACAILGMCPDHVTIIQHDLLPDRMHTVWDKRVLAALILRHVEQLAIDTLLTFDAHGVSGHANHRALFHSVQCLYSLQRLPAYTRVFVLDSVCLVRKYSGLLDMPCSTVCAKYIMVCASADVAVARTAMRLGHRSQMKWFRWVYVYTSRYLYVNTWRRIAMLPRTVNKKRS